MVRIPYCYQKSSAKEINSSVTLISYTSQLVLLYKKFVKQSPHHELGREEQCRDPPAGLPGVSVLGAVAQGHAWPPLTIQ